MPLVRVIALAGSVVALAWLGVRRRVGAEGWSPLLGVQVALPAGGYKIYLVDAGRPASEYQVELRPNEPRQFTVVSR